MSRKKEELPRGPRGRRRKSPLDYAITPTPEYRKEWERHAEMFKDAGSFEDDPAAEMASDKHGTFNRRSLSEGHLTQGDDMGNYSSNGEKPQ